MILSALVGTVWKAGTFAETAAAAAAAAAAARARVAGPFPSSCVRAVLRRVLTRRLLDLLEVMI